MESSLPTQPKTPTIYTYPAMYKAGDVLAFNFWNKTAGKIKVVLQYCMHECMEDFAWWLVQDEQGNQYICDEGELDTCSDNDEYIVSPTLPKTPARPSRCKCHWGPPNRWRHFLHPLSPLMSEKKQSKVLELLEKVGKID